MDQELLVRLLRNKTEEIQSLLRHFEQHPQELSTNIRLLSDRIEGLSSEFKVLQEELMKADPDPVIEVKTPQNEPKAKAIVIETPVEETPKQAAEAIVEQAKPNDSASQSNILNEQLHRNNAVIGEKLKTHRLADIQSAIGINDRFLFIRELFDNSSEKYQQSIDFINQANSMNAVEQHFKNTMNWDFEDPTVIQFMELSQRKF